MLAVAQMQLCASPLSLRELEEVIARPVFDRYLDVAARREFVAPYRRHVRIFQVQPDEESRPIRPCRDPRDNKFLALAIVASADVIVSTDDDLLAMTPYQEISILNPTDFIVTDGSPHPIRAQSRSSGRRFRRAICPQTGAREVPPRSHRAVVR